ncbi:MAG: hypothetical protein JNJ60_17705 [Rhodocyclaceae bacterium]|nr:hypothetical protein [Rhodocyclaceae bacterium]
MADMQFLSYSCAACPHAGQAANHINRLLQQRGVAEPRCALGVALCTPEAVRDTLSGRPVMAIDSCPCECVKRTLMRNGVMPAQHWRIDAYGLADDADGKFDASLAAAVATEISVEAEALLARHFS